MFYIVFQFFVHYQHDVRVWSGGNYGRNIMKIEIFGLIAQREERMRIERPRFKADLCAAITVPPQLYGCKEFEVEVAYFQKAVVAASTSFKIEMKKVASREVKKSNDTTIRSLAEMNISESKLLECCTPELAMAVMKRRQRALERELRAVQQAGMEHIIQESLQTLEEVLGKGISEPVWSSPINRPPQKGGFTFSIFWIQF
jgi:hypothetical protein